MSDKLWWRLVRIQGLTSDKIRLAVDRYRREDLALIEQAPGFLGIAMGENHVGGSVVSVTFWDSEQAMRDTERLSAEARQRALSILDAPESMLVDHFEMTFTSHLATLASASVRPHMRLVRFNGLPRESIDLATDSYREDARRHLHETIGVEGIALGANHDVGSLAIVSFWSSRRNMAGAEQLSQRVRDRASAAAAAAQVPRDPLEDRIALVDRFEITLASHLDRLATVQDRRVPSPV